MRDPEDIAYISQLHDEATEAAQEIASLRAEIERLRALCIEAAQWRDPDMVGLPLALTTRLMAAGRGEG